MRLGITIGSRFGDQIANIAVAEPHLVAERSQDGKFRSIEFSIRAGSRGHRGKPLARLRRVVRLRCLQGAGLGGTHQLCQPLRRDIPGGGEPLQHFPFGVVEISICVSDLDRPRQQAEAARRRPRPALPFPPIPEMGCVGVTKGMRPPSSISRLNDAISALVRGSEESSVSSKTQPCWPSLSAVPQNSQAPLVPPDSGAPQLGQWADEIPLATSVFEPAARART